MLRKVLMLALLFVLASSLGVWAQDNNDPNSNPDANACFEGGSMAGKCNVDFDGDGEVEDFELKWAWECGWYLIRYDAGIFSEIPNRCQNLLPAEVEVVTVTEEPGSYCYYQHSDDEFSIYEIIAPGEYKYFDFIDNNGGYPPCPDDLPV